jgi:hypothetical protein
MHMAPTKFGTQKSEMSSMEPTRILCEFATSDAWDDN